MQDEKNGLAVFAAVNANRTEDFSQYNYSNYSIDILLHMLVFRYRRHSCSVCLRRADSNGMHVLIFFFVIIVTLFLRETVSIFRRVGAMYRQVSRVNNFHCWLTVWEQQIIRPRYIIFQSYCKCGYINFLVHYFIDNILIMSINKLFIFQHLLYGSFYILLYAWLLVCKIHNFNTFYTPDWSDRAARITLRGCISHAMLDESSRPLRSVSLHFNVITI